MISFRDYILLKEQDANDSSNADNLTVDNIKEIIIKAILENKEAQARIGITQGVDKPVDIYNRIYNMFEISNKDSLTNDDFGQLSELNRIGSTEIISKEKGEKLINKINELKKIELAEEDFKDNKDISDVLDSFKISALIVKNDEIEGWIESIKENQAIDNPDGDSGNNEEQGNKNDLTAAAKRQVVSANNISNSPAPTENKQDPNPTGSDTETKKSTGQETEQTVEKGNSSSNDITGTSDEITTKSGIVDASKATAEVLTKYNEIQNQCGINTATLPKIPKNSPESATDVFYFLNNITYCYLKLKDTSIEDLLSPFVDGNLDQEIEDGSLNNIDTEKLKYALIAAATIQKDNLYNVCFTQGNFKVSTEIINKFYDNDRLVDFLKLGLFSFKKENSAKAMTISITPEGNLVNSFARSVKSSSKGNNYVKGISSLAKINRIVKAVESAKNGDNGPLIELGLLSNGANFDEIKNANVHAAESQANAESDKNDEIESQANKMHQENSMYGFDYNDCKFREKDLDDCDSFDDWANAHIDKLETAYDEKIKAANGDNNGAYEGLYDRWKDLSKNIKNGIVVGDNPEGTIKDLKELIELVKGVRESDSEKRWNAAREAARKRMGKTNSSETQEESVLDQFLNKRALYEETLYELALGRRINNFATNNNHNAWEWKVEEEILRKKCNKYFTRAKNARNYKERNDNLGYIDSAIRDFVYNAALNVKEVERRNKGKPEKAENKANGKIPDIIELQNIIKNTEAEGKVQRANKERTDSYNAAKNEENHNNFLKTLERAKNIGTDAQKLAAAYICRLISNGQYTKSGVLNGSLDSIIKTGNNKAIYDTKAKQLTKDQFRIIDTTVSMKANIFNSVKSLLTNGGFINCLPNDDEETLGKLKKEEIVDEFNKFAIQYNNYRDELVNKFSAAKSSIVTEGLRDFMSNVKNKATQTSNLVRNKLKPDSIGDGGFRTTLNGGVNGFKISIGNNMEFDGTGPEDVALRQVIKGYYVYQSKNNKSEITLFSNRKDAEAAFNKDNQEPYDYDKDMHGKPNDGKTTVTGENPKGPSQETSDWGPEQETDGYGNSAENTNPTRAGEKPKPQKESDWGPEQETNGYGNSTESTNPTYKQRSSDFYNQGSRGGPYRGETVWQNSVVTSDSCDSTYPVGKGIDKKYQKAFKNKLNCTTYTYQPNSKIKVVRKTYD